MTLTFDTRRLLRSPVFWLVCAMLVAFMIFGANPAHAMDATDGGGGGLPWETPLNTLKKSISGPVAFVIALLGIIACGATLIWGGEISEFARKMIFLVLVICLIVFSNKILTSAMFSGAMVPAEGIAVQLGSALSPIATAGVVVTR